MENKYQVFSNNLNDALCKKKLSPIEFANKLNISKQQMTKYLQGKAIPRQTRLNLIARRLDVTPEWLLGTYVKVSNTKDTYKKEEEKAQKNSEPKKEDVQVQIGNFAKDIKTVEPIQYSSETVLRVDVSGQTCPGKTHYYNPNTGESGVFDPMTERNTNIPSSNVSGDLKVNNGHIVVDTNTGTDTKTVENFDFTVDQALDLLESLNENITIGQYVRLRLIVDALTDSIKEK